MAEKTITGLGEIRVSPLSALQAIRLYADLMRVVGKASNRLPAIIVGFSSDEPIANGAAEIQAIQAVVDILSNNTSDEITRLVKELAEVPEIRQPSGAYRHLDIDGDFTGHLDMLLPVLRFVIEVQFRDFFTASVGNGIRELMRKA